MTSSENVPDDVSVTAVWNHLEADSKAVLVDVRTRPEWTFVGLPNLATLGRKPVLVEWLSYPDNRPNPEFVSRLQAELDAAGADKSTDIFFICRSGVRSLSAALAMTDAGYTRCHNVAGGFEGPLDGSGHRGTTAGWKAAGLPWLQG